MYLQNKVKKYITKYEHFTDIIQINLRQTMLGKKKKKRKKEIKFAREKNFKSIN